MIDTTVKHALQSSVKEFNIWASEKNYQKHTYTDLKGIFFNKLIKNLKGSQYLPNYWNVKSYNCEFIDKFAVHRGKISELSFTYVKSYDIIHNKVVDLLNESLKEVKLENIVEIPDFAKNIDNFKILK